MAQQSARRGRKNQVYSSCLEHAFMIWSPVCELPYGPRSFIAASSEAGQMAASDYVPNFLKNRLHLAGRPQMSTRPSTTLADFYSCRRSPHIHFRQCGHRCGGGRAKSARMA
jgi:hypothetical protein